MSATRLVHVACKPVQPSGLSPRPSQASVLGNPVSWSEWLSQATHNGAHRTPLSGPWWPTHRQGSSPFPLPVVPTGA